MNGTVFIVDDDAAVRRALAAILEGEGFTVLPFESAEEFLETCESQAAGCVLLDLRLQGMDGLQAQDAIAARGITLPVIFLTGHGDIPKSVRAMKAGAIDFLQKPVAADTLLARLTAREEQVLKRILAGRSAKQIGKELGISPRTIEVYRKNVLLKTQCANLLALSDLFRVAREETPVGKSQMG